MQLGILATDGGPHPPEKWARMSAWMITNHLVQVDERSSSPEAIEVREARDVMARDLYGVLKDHYTTVQNGERTKVQGPNGVDRLNPAFLEHDRNAAVAEHVKVDDVVAAIVAQAASNPILAAHFAKDEVKAQVREIFHKDAGSVIDIERDHCANGYTVDARGQAVRNPHHDPDHENVRMWQAARHTGLLPSVESRFDALRHRAKLSAA